MDGGINCILLQRWGLFQKQCQSSSIQCAATRYPRSSEHPLIQSSLFSGGQVAPLNGSFHGQAGCLPNMANTKAPESQIFNWSTSASQREKKFRYLCFYLKSTVQVDLLLSVGAVGVSQQVRQNNQVRKMWNSSNRWEVHMAAVTRSYEICEICFPFLHFTMWHKRKKTSVETEKRKSQLTRTKNTQV